MSLTIGETIQQLHHALRDYIEATYHVSDPMLVAQRRRLLEELGVIHQRPYLESTPRYTTGAAFRDLGLDPAALEVFSTASKAESDLGLLHDPPYQHQAISTKLSLVDGRSLVVITGTGSGKTECFLLPILGRLAREARTNGQEFGSTPAVRAMVLYPMNALVNDQLGRLRLLFGNPRIVKKFMEWSGRPARFARYTSRTLYPGVRDEKKDQHRLLPIRNYYVRNLELAQDSASPQQAAADALVSELKRRGKWPAKPDLIGWYGQKGSRWRDAKSGDFKRCVTLPGDPELVTRHEVHAAPPDILVTNYSMLEYMLMRPLERPIFDHTRDWLQANPEERFLLVIDEAHLYRGAAGAEVALLIRRLRMRLDIPADRIQVICTSASFKDPDHAVRFGAQLTGKDPADFRIVQGDLLLRSGAGKGTHEDAAALDALDLPAFYESGAAKEMGVRLRPELKVGESFQDENVVEEAVRNGALNRDMDLLQLLVQLRSSAPPESLLRAITKSLADRYYGLESLALASLIERPAHAPKIHGFPDVPGYAQSQDEKIALARAWLRCWKRPGFWLSRMPPAWWLQDVQPGSGKFKDMHRLLRDKPARTLFDKEWVPRLLGLFAEQTAPRKFRLKGGELSLEIGGAWAYCQSCRTAQRPFPGRATCVNCGQDTAAPIDPNEDPVFVARKGYYRASTIKALRTPPIAPMALIAAEHTAQLNTAQADEVFSKAEEHELLFQDVDLGPDDTGRERPAIDILSCTTTMEVGIDIGTLSGVSLRNMPPARANYQQRAGRAGRRGNAVATVTAFGSADSHDEHYFTHPDQMIRGAVDDPTLTLDNHEIARRHVTAFLLQRYYQAKLPEIEPEAQPHLFAVLGTVLDFKNPKKVLNRLDLEGWLRSNAAGLKADVAAWLPSEIAGPDRQQLLDELVEGTLQPIDEAIEYDPGATGNASTVTATALVAADGEVDTSLEAPDEEGEERPGRDPASENLLDRLLYKGVLPRYAFPTDVASFHVFDPEDRSTYSRPAFRFTPSQSLPVALSQYAPGKEVWIGGKLWTSGAVYSPMRNDRYRAWLTRRLYYECRYCHYARTTTLDDGTRGETKDCEACGGVGTFGPARPWLRPPGFAHPVTKAEGTSPDDQPARSYATRAKLTMYTPPDESKWTQLNDYIRVHHTRQHLLVTNRGPREEGYTYCTKCGLIEPTALLKGVVGAAHRKPYPDPRDTNCPGGGATKGLVLGTDLISDVLLVSMSVRPPLTLTPGLLATEVALRTISEALTKAACARLELEVNELQAEYRPALTAAGRDGREAEIYLYDTLPGGAGFAPRVGQLGLLVFEDALRILEECPTSCDRSCYRCLRSYKNKFEHELLDRHVGASLLRFVLRGTAPTLDAARLERSTDLLFQDLERHGVDGLTLERDKTLSIPGLAEVAVPILASKGPGRQFVIGLHGPLTPDEPSDEALRDLKEFSATVPVILIDELVVRRNLPSASATLLERLG